MSKYRMRNIAGRIVFQPTTVPLFLYNSHVNKGVCSDECDSCHATCAANIRTRTQFLRHSLPFKIMQHKAQRTCGMGNQIRLTFSDYCGSLNFQPTRCSHSLSVPLSRAVQTCATQRHHPLHTGDRNGVSPVDHPGFECQQRQEIFLFSKSRRSALRSTHIPIQLVPGSLPAVKTAGACS